MLGCRPWASLHLNIDFGHHEGCVSSRLGLLAEMLVSNTTIVADLEFSLVGTGHEFSNRRRICMFCKASNESVRRKHFMMDRVWAIRATGECSRNGTAHVLGRAFEYEDWRLEKHDSFAKCAVPSALSSTDQLDVSPLEVEE